MIMKEQHEVRLSVSVHVKVEFRVKISDTVRVTNTRYHNLIILVTLLVRRRFTVSVGTNSNFG